VARFDRDKVGTLSLRTFSEGDRFYPLGMRNSVKLKDFFISQRIPKEERRRVPLLLSGDDIIWVIGYRMDERYKITEATGEVLLITVRKT
jgi:tRNA(Ile)-lysidine synthase